MHQRPFIKFMSNHYEDRIAYLEEIVGLLLARQEPLPSSLFYSAPLAGSFRYSTDRGLVPLLSKETAELLLTAVSSHWTSPPRRRKLNSTFKPPIKQTQLIFACNSSTSTQPPLSVIPSISSTHEKHETSAMGPEQQHLARNQPSPVISQDISANLVIPLTSANTTSVPVHSPEAHASPIMTSSLESHHTSPECPLNDRCAPSILSSSGVVTPPNPLATSEHSQSNCQLNNPPPLSPETSLVNQFRPSGLAVPMTAIPFTPLDASISLLQDRSKTESIASAIATPKDSPATVSSASETHVNQLILQIITAQETSLRLNQENREAAALDRQAAAGRIARLEQTLTELTLKNNPSPHSESITTAYLPLPSASNPRSFAIAKEPLSPSYDIAALGSITIVDNTGDSADSHIAPDLSQTALENYKDLDHYLNTLEAGETKKKKKKKKKKTPDPPSITENPILFYV